MKGFRLLSHFRIATKRSVSSVLKAVMTSFRRSIMIHYTVIPRSYVVGVSETGIISRDDVSRVTFPPKRNVKMWRVVPDNLF